MNPLPYIAFVQLFSQTVTIFCLYFADFMFKTFLSRVNTQIHDDHYSQWDINVVVRERNYSLLKITLLHRLCEMPRRIFLSRRGKAKTKILCRVTITLEDRFGRKDTFFLRHRERTTLSLYSNIVIIWKWLSRALRSAVSSDDCCLMMAYMRFLETR